MEALEGGEAAENSGKALGDIRFVRFAEANRFCSGMSAREAADS